MASYKIRLIQAGSAYQISPIHFPAYTDGGSWQPAVNAYLCEDRIQVCFDLAGVEKSTIDLRVTPDRILLKGTRPSPEPSGQSPCSHRVLAMEIDYGCFSRELPLPAEVDPEKTTSEHRDGLLWVYLPLRKI